MTPSKLQIVGAAYRDMVRALLAMPRLVGIVLLVCVVQFVITVFVLPRFIPDKGVIADLARFGLDIVSAFFFTPMLIAVHRFILLNEVTPTYVLAPHEPRFRQFFAFSVSIAVMFLMAAIPQMLGMGNPGITIGITVVITWLALQYTLIFPAIAIDARGATVSNAMADAKGHLWFIFLSGLIAILPLLVLWGAVFGVDAALQSPGEYKESNIVMFAGFLSAVPMQTLLVAIASHLFRAFGDRLHLGRHGTAMAPSR